MYTALLFFSVADSMGESAQSGLMHPRKEAIMAAKNVQNANANVVEVLVPANKDAAEGDILSGSRTIVDKESGQVTWWVLMFADANTGEAFEVLMPEWWRRQYVTKSAFPNGLFRGMRLNAGYKPFVDDDGNQRRAFYLEPVAE